MGRAISGIRPAISVVIPAYNEARRLPGFLRELLAYLEREYAAGYEVVVVDDGSGDRLEEVISDCRFQISDCRSGGRSACSVTVLRHDVNCGKGAALRTGVLASVGDVVLLCDADGAARIEDERLLRAAIAGGADVAVGSRNGGRVERGELRVERRDARGTGTFCSVTCAKGASPRVTRHPVRRAAGWVFSRVVRAVFGLGLRDTQCGFKMLRGDVARSLFASMRETGYLVDLELLLLAAERGYRVEEVPITWQEMPSSKLSLWRDAGPVAADLWRLYRRMRLSGDHESRSSTPVPSPHRAARASHHSPKKRGSKSYNSRSKA